MNYSSQAVRIGKTDRHGWQKILIVAGLLCLLYNPPIFSFNSMHLVGLLSIAFLLIHVSRTVNMLRSVKIGGLLLGTALWFGYLLLSVVFLHAEDLLFAILPVYFLVDIIPFGMSVRIVCENNGWTVDDFIGMVVSASIIQALLSLAAFLSPEIQSVFVQRFLDYGYGEVVTELARTRFYGFAAGMTFDMPILQTMIALLVIHPTRKLKLSNYIIAVLLFFSAIINARNAIVVAVIGFFAMVFLDCLPLRKKLKYGIAFAMAAVAAAVVLLPVVAALAPSTYRWIGQGFREILAFLFKGDAGKEGSNYFAYIMNPDKYRAPGGLVEILFGVGHPTMGMTAQYGYASDIGYTNDLWLGGLVYMIPLYLFFAAIMWSMRRHSHPQVVFIGIFMLVMYPFVNIKGIAASANGFTYFLILLYVVTAGRSCGDSREYGQYEPVDEMRLNKHETANHICDRSSV